MKCLYNGNLIIGDKVLTGKAILFEDTILDIIDKEQALQRENLEKIDAKGKYIAPGFIDLHIHGYNGYDTMDADLKKLTSIATGIAQNGVTAFLPTTMTMSKEQIKKSLECVRTGMYQTTNGAQILGVHMEGPYINENCKGAQNGEYITRPDAKFVKEYQDVIRIVTVAPEVEGAAEFIKEVVNDTNIVISMGHTNATFEQAMKGIETGITHTTHCFNAMTGLHHRKPGVVGAGFTSDVSCEFIADTVHIHPGLFPFLTKIKGPDKLVLITDCMRAGGKPDGEYELGGQKVIVKDGKACLEDGVIAGSVLKLNEAIRNMIRYTDQTITSVVRYASENPAKVLGIQAQKGSLEVGKDADIVVFDEDINIDITIGKGNIIYDAD